MEINQERIDQVMTEFHQTYGVKLEKMTENRIAHYMTLIAFGASTWQTLCGALFLKPSDLEALLIDVDLNIYERLVISNRVTGIIEKRIMEPQGIDLAEAVKTLDINSLLLNSRYGM